MGTAVGVWRVECEGARFKVQSCEVQGGMVQGAKCMVHGARCKVQGAYCMVHVWLCGKDNRFRLFHTV